MRNWLSDLLDGELPFVGWDEGSKRGFTACIAYLNTTIEGEALAEWKTQWKNIEPTVTAPRKMGKGKGKGKGGRVEREEGEEGAGCAPNGNELIDAVEEKVRALLGIRYTVGKTGDAIAGCIFDMLRDLKVEYVYFALVDGASTNLGKHKGSVQRLRSKLKSPLISSIRCLCHIIASAQKTMMLQAFGESKRASIGRQSTQTAVLDRGSSLLEDVAAVVRGLPDLESHLRELELYDQQSPYGCGTRWPYYIDAVKWLFGMDDRVRCANDRRAQRSQKQREDEAATEEVRAKQQQQQQVEDPLEKELCSGRDRETGENAEWVEEEDKSSSGSGASSVDDGSSGLVTLVIPSQISSESRARDLL
jgi:hypothetical protein